VTHADRFAGKEVSSVAHDGFSPGSSADGLGWFYNSEANKLIRYNVSEKRPRILKSLHGVASEQNLVE
jgi:hypothetical protein